MEQTSQYLPGFSDFVTGQGITYPQYLQARQFEHSLRYGIQEQTLALVTSQDRLVAAQYEVIEAERAGTATLALQLDDISHRLEAHLDEITKTMEWGFSELLLSLGHVADGITELISISRTPAQTWAYEQFVMSQDEVRRRLFPEALASVTRAIRGYGGQPGYQSEFRFHYLLGVLHLGSFANCSPEVVNVAAAEQDFLAAHRYGEHDYPSEAARALHAAGRAAYVQGELERAGTHLAKSLHLRNRIATRYLYAKVLAAQGNRNEALMALERAIRRQYGYALKAAGDGDFARFGGEVHQLIARLHSEARELALAAETTLRDRLKRLSSYSAELPDGQRTAMESSKGAHSVAIFARELQEAATKCDSERTVASYVDFMGTLPRFDELSDGAFSLFNESARDKMREHGAILRREREKAGEQPAAKPAASYFAVEWGPVLAVIALTLLGFKSSDTVGEIFTKLLGAVVLFVIAFFGGQFAAASLRDAAVRSERRCATALQEQVSSRVAALEDQGKKAEAMVKAFHAEPHQWPALPDALGQWRTGHKKA